MISSVSSAQTQSASTGSSSGAQTEASLKKQIAEKEEQARKVTDQTESARLAAEINALREKLAALQAREKSKSDGGDNAAVARQAEFDAELLAETKSSRVI